MGENAESRLRFPSNRKRGDWRSTGQGRPGIKKEERNANAVINKVVVVD